METEYGLARVAYEKEAKGALCAIGRVGTDGLSERGRNNLRIGLDCGLVDQGEVDSSQHEYMIGKAKRTLSYLVSCGRRKSDEAFLEYGLKHDEFSQEDIDIRVEEYRVSNLLKYVRESKLGDLRISTVLDIWNAVNDGTIPKDAYLEACKEFVYAKRALGNDFDSLNEEFVEGMCGAFEEKPTGYKNNNGLYFSENDVDDLDEDSEGVAIETGSNLSEVDIGDRDDFFEKWNSNGRLSDGMEADYDEEAMKEVHELAKVYRRRAEGVLKLCNESAELPELPPCA
ncbi:hypothetical protein KAR91_59485 [Candidatus Pacearchaeota archaeon]|nr:hypothetical protein [Candidatus Pacearchaeota archaeon]